MKKKYILDLIESILALFYPAYCPGCNYPLHLHEKRICNICVGSLAYTRYEQLEFNPLKQKFAGRFPVDQVFSLVQFKKGTAIQGILHDLKYGNHPELGRYLGNLMGYALRKSDHFRNITHLVPIPLHPSKQQKRGYNQAEQLAIGIQEVWKSVKIAQPIKRVKDTQTQTKKSRTDRFKNLEGSFEIHENRKINHWNILLIDDVLTTGSTLESCAILLHQHSPSSISFATLACAE